MASMRPGVSGKASFSHAFNSLLSTCGAPGTMEGTQISNEQDSPWTHNIQEAPVITTGGQFP